MLKKKAERFHLQLLVNTLWKTQPYSWWKHICQNALPAAEKTLSRPQWEQTYWFALQAKHSESAHNVLFPYRDSRVLLVQEEVEWIVRALNDPRNTFRRWSLFSKWGFNGWKISLPSFWKCGLTKRTQHIAGKALVYWRWPREWNDQGHKTHRPPVQPEACFRLKWHPEQLPELINKWVNSTFFHSDIWFL